MATCFFTSILYKITQVVGKRAGNEKHPFHMPDFFQQDLLDRVSEIFSVIEGNIGENVPDIAGNCRRIQPSAETRFQHRHIYPLLPKIVQCNSRGELKKSRPIP